MNRIDRLFAITLLLQMKRRVTAAELALTFEVSERTIYRDMSALSEMGVPIGAQAGEGYELLEDFKLPPVMLSPDEAIALFLSGKMLMKNATGEVVIAAELALRKIAAALPDTIRTHAESLVALLDFFPAQQPLNLDEPHLAAIREAIQARRVLHLDYRAYMQESSEIRCIEPHHLTYSDGAWYVSGYCRTRMAIRSFRLNRISTLTLADETFEPRILFPPKVELIDIRVRFNPQIIPHVHERQHYAYSHSESDDVLVYRVRELREIQNWLFGFGANAEVLSPDSLRQAMREEAQRLINLLT